MDNKYLFAVVGGVFLFAWFWVGVQPYYATEAGGIETWYLFAAILVLALGGGDSEGSDLVSVLSSSITGYIPKFIALTIATVVGSALYYVVVEGGFDAMETVSDIATLLASGVVVILTVACLKKAS